ncbi:hypothetical protein GCM10019016_037700 [Streptomyces prasinosporus]|uniref:Uncharacterized protein n=2 Tax=Streptomyces prasinosporus TaxID=68256 RepID=A0ABP6TQ61_9ACTN
MRTPSLSDPDQRMLLHDIADRINTVADQLPLPDQVQPGPGLGEILDDEVRHLARLLCYLAGESAFRHRAATRYAHQVTPSQRRTTLALARAAEPAGAALAALGGAVHCLGVLADLSHRSSGRVGNRTVASAHRQLVAHLAESRAHLARAAKCLRTAADAQSIGPAPSPPTAAPAHTR